MNIIKWLQIRNVKDNDEIREYVKELLEKLDKEDKEEVIELI